MTTQEAIIKVIQEYKSGKIADETIICETIREKKHDGSYVIDCSKCLLHVVDSPCIGPGCMHGAGKDTYLKKDATKRAEWLESVLR